MVPDFSRLRGPFSTIADVRPPDPKSSAASEYVKSFFMQPFSEKGLPSDEKSSPFCQKHRHSAVKVTDSQTNSPQNTAPQTAAKLAPAQAVADQLDSATLFYQLWTALPSWSPIIKKSDGWLTVLNPSGKKVPLVLGTVESYYRRDIILGKRFGKLTNYLMIDIDINSPFHPRNGGIDQILAAMESLGLCRYLLIRSSDSEGIHIYFPLAEPVSAWGIACAAHAALTAAGITIAGGICELFPNKKAFNAEHNGHRLPLQKGSFLLDNDFCPISNHKADFLHRWQTAAAHQDDQVLQQALNGNAVYTSPSTPVELPPVGLTPQIRPTPTARTAYIIPPIAWTAYGQSNDIMCELVNYGDRYAGHKNSTDLAAWVKAVAPQLSGYQAFASPKSKRDIEHGTWAKRWAEAHFRSKWKYSVGGSDHNANVAADAKRRIFAALDRMCVDAAIKVTQLWKDVSAIAKSCFDKGVGWDTFKKYKDEVLAHIKSTWKLGLSSGGSEDVNSFSSELAKPQITGSENPAKNCYTQLLTLRCVIDIYSSAFTQFNTPKNEDKLKGDKTAQPDPKLCDESPISEEAPVAAANSAISVSKAEEKDDGVAEVRRTGLGVGQRVRIVMPGGSLDGIETRVLAQTADVLGQPVYRLAYQRQGQAVTLPAECLQVVEATGKEKAVPGEAVIRATAAQLLQVLGQACPFSGPGLWTVKRSEVTTKAWCRLLKLIKEGELKKSAQEPNAGSA